jgi:hypothetical protein
LRIRLLACNDRPAAAQRSEDRSAYVRSRPLGRTGVSVSQLCLGAMMFGALGNPGHDASIKIIHRALTMS